MAGGDGRRGGELMPNPRGFLEIERVEQPEREPRARIGDHDDLHERLEVAELSMQGERCMGCGVPFCLNGCPLGNLIPDWNGLVAEGEWRRAIDQLHATNPFPELTGLICPAPCESACVLEINAEPVTIKQIELSIVERAWAEGWIEPQPPAERSGRRVAVVGSGPAGMAVAVDLNRAGHTVIVYERDEAPGGLNRFGVPDAKLPKGVIDRRIGQMEGEGIEFRCGVDVGGEVDPIELLGEVDALVIATGARVPRRLEVPGAELPGVVPAMTYLYARNRAVAAGTEAEHAEPTAAGKDVVVIGGGDTGADCMSNALREGAKSVTQLDTYAAPAGTRPREIAGWPAQPRRLPTHYALDEGGERRSAVAVTAVAERDGRAAAIEAVRVDPADRTRHLPDGELSLPADLVLVAIGFTGPEAGLPDALGLPRAADSTLANRTTDVPGVFTAGDARMGARLTVTAIDDGRRCAREVDRWLATRV
ncbi:MAG TPA: glutamate synthase subunit beta [Solirubrobacterales bacterium]|nr:glutamate synthase subunit beta [Solirubrobacterales bacterium]